MLSIWVGDKPLQPLSLAVKQGESELDLSQYASATVDIVSPSGSLVDVTGVDVTLDEDRVVISLPGDRSLFTTAGLYTLQVALRTVSAVERLSPQLIEVKDPAPYTTSAWATPADVLTTTGALVDTDDIARAQSVLDSVTGVGSLVYADLSSRNKRMLKLAAAYQAAWMQEQPDLYSRHDVAQLGANAGAVTPRDSMTFVLAPLAKHALARCSWAGSRTRRVGRPYRYTITDPAVADDHGGWVPL